MTIDSTRGGKRQLQEVDPLEALDLLAALPLFIWEWREEAAKELNDYSKHMGAFPEDLAQLLALGDARHLHFGDVVGVAMAAAKGAGQRIAELEARIVELEKRYANPLQEVDLDGPV